MGALRRTSRRRVNASVNTDKALALRLKGLSFRAIGKQLGISNTEAHRLVITELRRINTETAEKADELRRLELQRLDLYLERLNRKVAKGDTRAVEVSLKVADRRAKLLGIDAPVKVETGELGGTAAANALRELAAAIESGEDLTQ